MKIFASLLLALSIAPTAFADSNNGMPSQSQQIANFLGGSTAPSFCQQMAGQDSSSSTTSGWSWNSGSTGSSGNFQGCDFSSFFNQLSSSLGDQHFDPNNLQSFINNLHLDPALLSQVQMFVQNLQNQNSQSNNGNGDENANGNNGNGNGDENANGNNGNGNGDENANNDNGNGDENANADNENDNDQGDEQANVEDDEPVAVPEPSTFALMVAGAALLGGALLRRRMR